MASRAVNILQGAREALSIAKGEEDPATYKVHVPADIDVRAIRAATGMTQAAFAAAYGFPAGTLRDWEQGRTRPDMAAKSYLLVIKSEPQTVRKALNVAAGEFKVRGDDVVRRNDTGVFEGRRRDTGSSRVMDPNKPGKLTA